MLFSQLATKDHAFHVNSEALKTLPLGLAGLRGAQYTEWNMVMAGTAISVIPTILLFVIGQRYFQRSVVITGLK